MAGFHAIPAHGRKIMSYSLDLATDFLAGAAVLLDGDEEVVECGADPALILGFAAHPSLGRDVLPDEQLVFVAHADATFWMEATSAWAASDVNVAYGLVKSADGIWRVDKTDTTATRVVCVRVDLIRNLGEVYVLEANRQQNT